MLDLLVFAQMNKYVVAAMVVVFLAISVFMILTVLIQRPQGGGLVGAFGSGGGSGQTAFGAKTGDALTILTIAIFVVYILVAVLLNYMVRPPEAAVIPTAGPGPAETTSVPVQPPTGASGGVPINVQPLSPDAAPDQTPAPAEGAAPAGESAPPTEPQSPSRGGR